MANQSMVKIEILLDREHVDDLVDLFDRHGVAAFTVLDVRDGRGSKRGTSLALGLSGQSGAYVFVVRERASLDALLPALVAFLRSARGFGFLTPVESLLA